MSKKVAVTVPSGKVAWVVGMGYVPYLDAVAFAAAGCTVYDYGKSGKDKKLGGEVLRVAGKAA